ncbi:MAG: hypothetical protein DIU65_13645 [Proteobacteria bacterium]|nr:MAG: hypothetical protein DIU65_13645 [Pseudomonadota bacterium]
MVKAALTMGVDGLKRTLCRRKAPRLHEARLCLPLNCKKEARHNARPQIASSAVGREMPRFQE